MRTITTIPTAMLVASLGTGMTLVPCEQPRISRAWSGHQSNPTHVTREHHHEMFL